MNYDNYELEFICALMTSETTPDFIEVVDKIEPLMFQNGSFREMYKAVKSLYMAGVEFDVLSVADRTGIDAMGMVEMIKKSTGHSSRVKYFAKRVRQGYYLRMARNEFSKVIDAIDECSDESMIGSISEMVEAAVTNLVVETDKKKPVLASDLTEKYMDVLDERFRGLEHDSRLRFGIEAIDKKTGGINPTDLVIIGGCPGMGKTELMVKLSNSASSENGGSLMFSMEMSETEVIERSIAIESNLSITSLRNPLDLDDYEVARIGNAVNEINKKRFHVLDQSGLTVNEIFAQAIDHKSRNPDTNLICVDYAGLVSTAEQQDKVQALGEVGKKLKQLAKQIKTPVILLSQVVSKSIEQRGDKRPLASDLKGSSELQDAADWILFPYRDVVYNEDSYCKDIAEIGFAKARHGTQGAVYMGWTNGHFVDVDQHYAYSQVSESKSRNKSVKIKKDF